MAVEKVIPEMPTIAEISELQYKNQQEQETSITAEKPTAMAAEVEITTAEQIEPKYEQEAKQTKNINDSKTQEQTKLPIMSKKEQREERREKKKEDKKNSNSRNSWR